MNRLTRWLLRAMTLAVPVVIAACYGPSYRYRKDGKVIDRQTREGISGIHVECRNGTSYGHTGDISQAGGDFSLAYNTPCTSVRASPMLNGQPVDDGGSGEAALADAGLPDAAGGAPADDGQGVQALYLPVEVPFDEDADTLLIEMQRIE